MASCVRYDHCDAYLPQTPSIYSIDAEKGGRLELMSGSEEAMVHLLWFTLSLLGKRGWF